MDQLQKKALLLSRTLMLASRMGVPLQKPQ